MARLGETYCGCRFLIKSSSSAFDLLCQSSTKDHSELLGVGSAGFRTAAVGGYLRTPGRGSCGDRNGGCVEMPKGVPTYVEEKVEKRATKGEAAMMQRTRFDLGAMTMRYLTMAEPVYGSPCDRIPSPVHGCPDLRGTIGAQK